MTERATLIKFGQYKHLSQLQSEGVLYMNTVQHFSTIEDKEARGDKLEGADEICQGERGTVRPSKIGAVASPVGSWWIETRSDEAERMNIFCMYAARPTVGSFPVHERVSDFGDFALVLREPDQFIRRVASVAKSEGISIKANLVEYVDDGYTGELGPFKKLRRFAWQSEWRLACYDGPGAARILSIGSISEISALMQSSEVNERVRDTGSQLVIR